MAVGSDSWVVNVEKSSQLVSLMAVLRTLCPVVYLICDL